MDSGGNGQERRTIIGGRRRRPGAAPPGGRERAETPQRRDQGSRGGGGGGQAPFGGNLPSLPGGKGCLPVVSGVVLVLVVVIFFVLQMQGGPASEDQRETPTAGAPSQGQIANLPAAAGFTTNLPAVTPTPALAGAPPAGNQRWLVMLYQDADDSVLEKDIYLDVNEAEKAGPSDRVKIVAQVDRYTGAYGGDGNWTGTKRFLIQRDDNLAQLRSQEIADLGELNMASARTLIDFATWAIQTYPADRYALILSDHGMGWPGGWSDASPRAAASSNTALGAQVGDLLYLDELDDALGQIRAQTGLDKFELIGMDACLMGQIEVFTALEPHARYAVASEEVEPALGWAYTDFLQALSRDPDMGGAELGRLIVTSYIEDDQRILDAGARADFLSQGSPFGGLFGQPTDVAPQRLAREIGQESTLSAVDLAKIRPLNESLNRLAFLLQQANQQPIASSRSYAQNFTSPFGSELPSPYIDLGNFLQIAKQKSGNAELGQAADAVLSSLGQAVIAEKHGSQEPGATGIAIYFPNSQLYRNQATGAASYTAIARRFAATSLWDDFLAYHYAGQKFAATDARAVVPPGTAVRSPASGGITISPVTASSSRAAPGQSVTLSADISGDNIGYIYLLVGFYDRSANSVFVADRDYIESTETRQVNGVYYPDWGEGEFTLQFTWEPVVFAIRDSATTATVLLEPTSYGRSYEEAVYTVDGAYTFAESGEERNARLHFTNGVLRQVFAFTGETEAGAPREVTPSAGDRFTVRETWLDLDDSGGVSATSYQAGNTLTFGDRMFVWDTLDAAAGEYVVGFVVEDLDGNSQQALTRITVE